MPSARTTSRSRPRSERAPSGTGGQASLLGILGILAAAEEGVEVNLLGLSLGMDGTSPALRLPGLSRVGLAQSAG